MRLLCSSIHTAVEVGTGSGVTVRQGTRGTILDHSQMRSLSVIAAILDDMGDKLYRFVAWDVEVLERDFVIVQYEAARLNDVSVKLMPPAKDLVSLAIAGDCRQELGDLYEYYQERVIAGTAESADIMLGGKLKPLMDAVTASIKDKTR